MRIILIDADGVICEFWQKLLQSRIGGRAKSVDIEVFHGYLDGLDFSVSEESVFVSPGNSFGGMGGGYDKALASLFAEDGNWQNTDRFVRGWISANSRGYSSPGTAQLIEFSMNRSQAWKKHRSRTLLHLPTMVTPGKLGFTKSQTFTAVFDWTWQCLIKIHQKKELKVAVFTGMGTGYGQLDKETVCNAMVSAIFMFAEGSGAEVPKFLEKTVTGLSSI
ncbi:hypothetical protein OGAPHI_001879 [Ogataea philodendri]|uniref:Macro-like domain-containing protein n=1 Tax=Ogataea philodendri TaxID=1378263 RepID=A0A9P8PAR1_9ASCO|nr:uncharacterized protein OGAPHI_001879 [Ogataea philodendri]KAH3668125.1 hypothetical protein OGAPHI_001879 [Ogataea philodendri]